MSIERRPARWAGALAAITLSLLTACGGGATNDPASSAGAPALELVAVGSSARTASLGWKPVAGASGYSVERRTATSAYAPVATLAADAAAFVDDGLEANTAYTYRLVANGVNAAPAEQVATTSADLPIVTPTGAAVGAATAGTLDAAGGSLAAADGSVSLTLPAGAVPAATEVRLQPITNPVPDGVGQGVRVHVGAAPAQPPTLTLAYAAALDAQADGLGVAVQRGDGSWLTAPVTAIDKTRRTLTVQLPATIAAGAKPQHATAAAASGVSLDVDVVTYLNFYLSPRESTVQVGATQLLVPYAHTLVAIGTVCSPDETGSCLRLPLLDTREVTFENQKAGYTRRWFVFAEEGGAAGIGTITPRAGSGAVYRAPAHEPDPNPVLVTFQSKHDKTGRTLTLTASIRVKEPVWTGTIHGTLEQSADIGFAFSAEAVWAPVPGSDGHYEANGTQSVHVINITCTASASPATVPLPPGLLTIDRSVEPPRYTLDVGSLWNTVITGTCPGQGSASVGMTVPGRLQVEGTVGGNGTTIEGSTSQNHITWDWALTNQL